MLLKNDYIFFNIIFKNKLAGLIKLAALINSKSSIIHLSTISLNQEENT